jgi:hypothetical protein
VDVNWLQALLLAATAAGYLAVAKLKKADDRREASRHESTARAMGGRVIDPHRDGEVARYAGDAGGLEWTLRVVSTESEDTPRNTTLVWAAASLRSESVLAVIGNDVAGAAGGGGLTGARARLDVDPTVDFERTSAEIDALLKELDELRKREPDPQRWVAASREVSLRRGFDGRPSPVVAFGAAARDVTAEAPELPAGFRVFAEDANVAPRIVSPEVSDTLRRWHTEHGGSLRIWVGGPYLRFRVSDVTLPRTEGFALLGTLGRLLADNLRAIRDDREEGTTPAERT